MRVSGPVKQYAQTLNVDLSEVEGTGANGAVKKADVDRAAANANKKVEGQSYPRQTPDTRPADDPSTMTAASNGTPIDEYASRVYRAQSATIPETLKIGRVERALINQGYEVADVRRVVESMYHQVSHAG